MRPSLILPSIALLAGTVSAQSLPARSAPTSAHGTTAPTPTSRPASAPATQKLPFTISKETTRITAPLRPDGTVDYLAALNQKYSQNVTPANNGFVAWIQIFGTGESLLPQDAKARILQLAGTSEPPPNVPISKEHFSWVRGAVNPKPDPSDKFSDNLAAALRGPWRSDTHPDLTQFLIVTAPLLTRAAEAADRPYWWIPAVPNHGQALLSVSLPGLAPFRGIANIFLARALLRASYNNFDGCLADIKAARQIARQIGSGPDMINRVLGIAIENQATVALASIALQGNLTEAQCQTAAAALDQLGPVPTVIESMDIHSRWIVLDMLQWAALNITPDDPPTPAGIDTANVDWDTIFKDANAYFDDYIRAANDSDIRQYLAAFRALDKRAENQGREADSLPQDLARNPGESRQAYTHRVSLILLHTLCPAFGKAEELNRRCTQQTDMTRLLLAAAQYKARTHVWPKAAADLVPNDIKILPKDIYSENAAAPLRYLLTPTGPLIYSVGENARDDAGIRDSNGKDDLAIGAP